MKKKRNQLKRPETGGSQRLDAPTGGEAGSTQHLSPHFSLEFVQSKYCLSLCDAPQKAAFANRLLELSQLTWVQLYGANRHGQGCEKIPQTAITGDTIPRHITSDVSLLAFRFDGKAPMVGYRSGRVFHILWFDRNFSLYNHGA